MGTLLTLALIGIIVLAAIGVGVQNFAMRIFNGAQTIYQNPTVNSLANQAGQTLVSLLTSLAQHR